MHLALPKGLLGTNDMRWSEIAVHAQGFGEMYINKGFSTIRDVVVLKAHGQTWNATAA
ncbi:hypothetical protein [Vibrio sp. M260121]|uniref:hypothetical protein n=1 Tax=Vibrio sp. M260121 TaxID=3020897 RepID=UPI002F4197DD